MTAIALLIMDVQQGIAERFAHDGGYLDQLATAIAAARSAGVTVIYVTVAFRPGYRRSASVTRASPPSPGLAGSPRPTLASRSRPPSPAPDGVTVTKRRVSAFTGSDLEVLLRARGTGHLVLAGIAPSGVVRSTLRQAADRDYQLTALADGCLDPDPGVHQVLMGKVFPRQTEVTTIAEWADRMQPAAPSADGH